VGGYSAIFPEVSSTAYITAYNQMVTDPNDPLKGGFLF
jgi:proline racemase